MAAGEGNVTANSRRRAMGPQRLVKPGDNVNCRYEGSERTGEEACPFVHARVEPDTCHARRIDARSDRKNERVAGKRDELLAIILVTTAVGDHGLSSAGS
jgi:hypothetical protein